MYWRRKLLLLLTLFCWTGWPVLVTAADAARAENELRQLRSRIGQLQKQLTRNRERESSLVAQLGRVEKQLGTIGKELRDTGLRQKQAGAKLRDLRIRQEQEAGQLSVLRERVADQVRASYALGRQGQLKIWLSQDDPATVGRLLTYHRYLARDRAARMDAVREQLARLAETGAGIERESRELSTIRTQFREEQVALQEHKAAREQVLEQLRADIRSQKNRLATYQENEQRLEKLLKDLQAALADVGRSGVPHTDFSKLKRKLPWPVKGKLAAAYGQRRPVGGGNLKWRGVFIQTPAGSEVHAVSHGRVAFSDWLRGFGLLLIIDHGDGYMSLYGHNQALYKSVGEWVETDEVIAASGNSGGADRTGLYFELRHRGRTMNPLKWCAGKPKA